MWSEKRQFPFNVSKCATLHIGRTNCNHVYTMDGCDIKQASEEKDLGITDSQLKFHKHAAVTVSKARRLLGMINKCFINLSPQTFPYLYKSIVRPCLNIIWGPKICNQDNTIN